MYVIFKNNYYLKKESEELDKSITVGKHSKSAKNLSEMYRSKLEVTLLNARFDESLLLGHVFTGVTEVWIFLAEPKDFQFFLIQ